MYTYTGKTALITGASSGIGETFARALAARGMNLLLVARSEDKLKKLATELSGQHNIAAEVIVSDLSSEGAGNEVHSRIQQRNLSVDMLVNNAGFGTHGRFETLAREREHAEVMLNVTAVVDLTHAFLPEMVKRGEGAVINVASTASFQPVPYMAVYAASKAFVLSFSEALWGEYHRRGVRILALCPGATRTAFFQNIGSGVAALGNQHTPERVVEVALRALERGRSYVIEGWLNYLLAQLTRFSPRQMVARISASVMRPRPAK